LKKNKYTIFRAWILLICFVAGQYMVYMHQHNILRKSAGSISISKNQPKPTTTVQEKCYLCDAMHNTTMVIAHHAYYFPVIVQSRVYKTGDYNFISIALIHSAGRAPPVASFSC